MKQIFLLLMLGLLAPLTWAAPATTASDNSAAQSSAAPTEDGNADVMQAFVTKEAKDSDIVAIEDQTKRLIMFLMGVPLLILLIATTALGVAMGVYGKQVFLPHMICAGLSVTLAMAHAVVGIVWFYPF
jgi:hypothetical protein